MSLPPRNLLASWPDEIAAAAETQMNIIAKFYDTAGTLKVTTKGRWQQKRSPLDASSATSWSTKRAGHIQVPLTASTGLIPKGWITQISAGVDDKGVVIPLRDPTLGLISFTVQSAVNSSHAPLRTIEVVSEVAATPRVT